MFTKKTKNNFAIFYSKLKLNINLNKSLRLNYNI